MNILKKYISENKVKPSNETTITLGKKFNISGIHKPERTIFDWDSYTYKRYEYYYLAGEVEERKNRLYKNFKKSRLSEYSCLFIGFGWNSELFEIATELFISEWDEFEMIDFVYGFSPDGKLIFEFIDDWTFLLYTNFEIEFYEPPNMYEFYGI
ncbi:MAG: hypothetical protein EAZ06_12110 [Cytophagales bacterium]|nr:MAG: hypothetical protein EAZ06_12110 [Cytophagales bacterium]